MKGIFDGAVVVDVVRTTVCGAGMHDDVGFLQSWAYGSISRPSAFCKAGPTVLYPVHRGCFPKGCNIRLFGLLLTRVTRRLCFERLAEKFAQRSKFTGQEPWCSCTGKPEIPRPRCKRFKVEGEGLRLARTGLFSDAGRKV